MKRLSVMRKQCATCPFKPGSQYAELRGALELSALTSASRICHSTGSNAINARTGKPERLCRGARDRQLQMFASIGFIESATDAAWDKKCKELGL